MADIKNHSTLATNLVSYWDMQEASETRYDLVGSSNLTDNNTALSLTGKIGNGVDFVSASSEYLSNTGFDFADTDYSIAGWFKFDSVAGNNWVITKMNGSDFGYQLYTSGTTLAWVVYDGGTGNLGDNTITSAVSAGTWHFIVVYHDSVNSETGLSIDGGTFNTQSLSGNAGSSSAEFRIGSRQWFSGMSDMSADEVGVWSKVLTQSEVTDLYNSSNGLPYYDPADVKNDTTLSTSLVSYWEMEQSAGSTATDSHGSNDLSDNNTVGSGTGKNGNCADYEASSTQYHSIATSPAGLNPNAGSISMWVNYESLSTSEKWLADNANANGGIQIINATTTKYITGRTRYTTASYQSCVWSTTPSLATWYHIVYTFGATSNSLYINGVYIDGNTFASDTPFSSTGSFAIGNYGGGGSYSSDGLVDEVAVWSKELSVAEVRALYGYGTPPVYEATPAVSYIKTRNTVAVANIQTVNTVS